MVSKTRIALELASRVTILSALVLSVHLLFTYADPFKSADQYHYMFDIQPSALSISTVDRVRKAEKGTTVHIYLSSHGGSVAHMLQIITAIQTSKADVIIHVDGFAFSAAAIITFAGNDVVIPDDALVMFHVARYNTPKGTVLLPLNHPVQQHLIKMMDKYAGHVLTDLDVRRVLNGEDVFISGKEIKRRLELNPKKKNDHKLWKEMQRKVQYIHRINEKNLPKPAKKQEAK